MDTVRESRKNKRVGSKGEEEQSSKKIKKDESNECVYEKATENQSVTCVGNKRERKKSKKRSRSGLDCSPRHEIEPVLFVNATNQDNLVQADVTSPPAQQEEQRAVGEWDDYIVFSLKETYPDLGIPKDMTQVNVLPPPGFDSQFNVFESSLAPMDACPQTCGSVLGQQQEVGDPLAALNMDDINMKIKGKRKRITTARDRVYRSDREFVKRHSHKRMIWFFRKVGIRHPAAIRTHLEKVKHPEFELPNLQCVLPHPGLTIAVDENCEDEGYYNGFCDGGNNTAGWANRREANMTYYQIYCPTETLVRRVKAMMGEGAIRDADYNKRVLSFIADIIGRLLWHHNRTHTVMFAKSDHYDRDCFLLYSRQAEPTPFMMRSDKYFCRRHDSDRFKHIAPQPDLTRANSTRLSSDSAIYVVGCNIIELWESFPYEYRMTRSRQMKPIYDNIRRIDSSVLEHAFSSINTYVNGDRTSSPYVEVASKTSFDFMSALLRDADLREAMDDSVGYKSFVERFVTSGILNVHCMLKTAYEKIHYGGYRDNAVWSPSPDRLDRIVLHHVHYRREVRELRTNRVFYYRNECDFVCSLSLVDDLFEEHIVLEENNGGCKDVVYFYDVFVPFEYGHENDDDLNSSSLLCWDDVKTMIQESSFTIGERLTVDVLRGPVPEDPFYPSANMSPTDLAIDHMLERAIKHSKKLQIPTPNSQERKPLKRLQQKQKSGNRGGKSSATVKRDELKFYTEAITNAMSNKGGNRLQEGYVSPPRQEYVSDHHVEHNGQNFHLKISATFDDGESQRKMTRVEYGPKPSVTVDGRTLLCVYVMDPVGERQIQVGHGEQLTNRNHPEFIKLRMTDRVVRVFTLKAEQDAYVVKPHVYYVFRKNPICSVDSGLPKTMLEQITASPSGTFPAFDVFKEFQKNNQPDVCLAANGETSPSTKQQEPEFFNQDRPTELAMTSPPTPEPSFEEMKYCMDGFTTTTDGNVECFYSSAAKGFEHDVHPSSPTHHVQNNQEQKQEDIMCVTTPLSNDTRNPYYDQTEDVSFILPELVGCLE